MAKDMTRARELYDMQEEDNLNVMDAMDAEYPEDNTPSEDDSCCTNYNGEGAMEEAVKSRVP